MHIAFLSWRDTTHPDGGGSEVFVESVGRELARRGHQVTLLCARHENAASHEFRDGLTLRRVGGRLTVYLWGLAWLVRHRHHVDVVVDVVNGLPFASPLVRRHGVVALVHHVHAEQWRIIYPGWRGRLGWFVESRVVPWLYRGRPFLTVSESSARDLVSLGVVAGDLTVVRNGLETVPTTPASAKSASPRLAVLSRLVPHKQIEHAFMVVARLSDEFPELCLDLVGNGWWRDELVMAAARHGVSDRVIFHGHVTDDRRDELMAQAWVMVMPSVKEGWCLAISEAGAQSTPSVAYASAGGVTESIDDRVTGYLAHDLDQMVDQVRGLLRDAAQRDRMGNAAREKAVSLTWSQCAGRAEGVLAAAARGRQSP